MIIKGFVGVTLIDFPGLIAATLFTSGCGFRCPYCYNPDLVLRPGQLPTLPTEDVLLEIEERKDFIEGIVVTGGEPLEQNDLEEFLKYIRKMGLKTKLDTNGHRPSALESLVKQDLLDFLSMDFKAPLDCYAEVVRAPVDASAIQQSLSLVGNASIPKEIRTTLHPLLSKVQDLQAMSECIPKDTDWIWQPVYPAPTLDPGFEVQESQELNEFRKGLISRASGFPGVRLRGLPSRG